MTKWKYTPEMICWLQEHSKGVEYTELAKQFNKKFHTDKTARQIQSACHDHDAHNGVYKIDHICHKCHWRPVGSKRLDKDGYVVVKIAEPCKWKREQLVVWEKYHEPIDIRKEMLIHLDGNRQNNNIENLYKISRRIIGAINQEKLAKHITPDTIDSIVAMMKLKVGAVDRLQETMNCSRVVAQYHYNPEKRRQNAKKQREKQCKR